MNSIDYPLSRAGNVLLNWKFSSVIRGTSARAPSHTRILPSGLVFPAEPSGKEMSEAVLLPLKRAGARETGVLGRNRFCNEDDLRSGTDFQQLDSGFDTANVWLYDAEERDARTADLYRVNSARSSPFQWAPIFRPTPARPYHFISLDLDQVEIERRYVPLQRPAGTKRPHR